MTFTNDVQAFQVGSAFENGFRIDLRPLNHSPQIVGSVIASMIVGAAFGAAFLRGAGMLLPRVERSAAVRGEPQEPQEPGSRCFVWSADCADDRRGE